MVAIFVILSLAAFLVLDWVLVRRQRADVAT